MRSLLYASLAIPLAMSSLAAQVPGVYTLGPIGCSQSCVSQNDPPPGYVVQSLPNEYTYAVLSPNALTVAAFSIYVESVSGLPESIQAAVYMSADGTTPDTTPVANAMIEVAGPRGWYTAVLDAPVSVPANTLFFIGADTNAVRPPDAGSGAATPPAGTFWRRPPFGGTSWTQTVIITSPIYRIHCLGSNGGVTTLTNSSLPVINTSLNLDVAGAPSGGVVIVGFGLSNTTWVNAPLPIDLGIVGATGCSALCSLDLLLPAVADSMGNASITFPIPNMPSIVGGTFYNQGLVFDSSANSFGLVTTNLGTAMIGG